MRRIRFLMLALLAVLAGITMWRQDFDVGATTAHETPPAATHVPAAMPPVASAPTADALPPEAHATLALIAAGGPYPYDRDGLEFRNFEGRLPKRARGWYHEYTVPTPGVDHRGARRIITGGQPPAEFWYTDDHYESFRAIEGGR